MSPTEKQSKLPHVACVILNYGPVEATARAAKSVLKSEGAALTTILVDNPAGGISRANELKMHFPDCTVISNKDNLGYAGGNNVGILEARRIGADYIWILSNDTEVEPTTLAEMLKVYESQGNVGQVGALTFYNHSTQIYFYRGQISHFGRTRNQHERYEFKDIPELAHNSYGDTDFVNGACLLIRAAHIDVVGLIPEDYFLYFEDPDWSLKFQRAGYRNLVAYRAKVYHLKGTPLRRNYVAEFYCRRNEYFFRRRNGFFVSYAHYLARLGLRWLKHFARSLAGVNRAENRNMMYVLSQVMDSVRHGQMGRFDIKVPYPEA